jgi:hypothetical protein
MELGDEGLGARTEREGEHQQMKDVAALRAATFCIIPLSNNNAETH